ncbi:GNAT family N-acetyltransferase [Arthrobacter gengyunqii]|uniref:GNAT family N-acetyltransferase n=1 Tax=Arthrobacter gengyunqii TaxID=2886940 RepID=A0ABS8GL60_9MICC|nr:GNAT family protein [Arthrobacter gengyunqii]MCC3267285.1 GNAT family N-acetyltransferase [Arthrobacter gengyunqii]
MTLSTPTLHTERLLLRPFADSDADELFALQSNAEVLRYWDTPPWTERSQVARFMTGCQTMADEGTGARVVLTRRSDGEFVGWCTFNGWNPDFRSASLGYCLTEAARVLEKLGFVREGTLCEDCIVNGDVSDSWVYGLLRRDWIQSAAHCT